MRRPYLAAAAGLLLALASAAGAADIRVLSIPGVKAPLEELAPQFERASGHKLAIRFEIFARMKEPIEAGDFDVAIFSKSVIDNLEKQGRIAASTGTDFARTSIGVAVRAGAPARPNPTSARRTHSGARCSKRNRSPTPNAAKPATTSRACSTGSVSRHS